MKSLVTRMDVLSRKYVPPPQPILVVDGTDPATWPQPVGGADAIYVLVYTGVERPEADPAACAAVLADYEARQTSEPNTW